MRDINDNLEVAISIVKEKIGDKIFGISTHNKEEVEEANSFNIDYIGLGAYRATDTKSEAKVLGDDIFEIAKLSNHKVAIIGGVKLDDKFGDEIYYSVVGSGLFTN